MYENCVTRGCCAIVYWNYQTWKTVFVEVHKLWHQKIFINFLCRNFWTRQGLKFRHIKNLNRSWHCFNNAPNRLSTLYPTFHTWKKKSFLQFKSTLELELKKVLKAFTKLQSRVWILNFEKRIFQHFNRLEIHEHEMAFFWINQSFTSHKRNFFRRAYKELLIRNTFGIDKLKGKIARDISERAHQFYFLRFECKIRLGLRVVIL